MWLFEIRKLLKFKMGKKINSNIKNLVTTINYMSITFEIRNYWNLKWLKKDWNRTMINIYWHDTLLLKCTIRLNFYGNNMYI